MPPTTPKPLLKHCAGASPSGAWSPPTRLRSRSPPWPPRWRPRPPARSCRSTAAWPTCGCNRRTASPNAAVSRLATWSARQRQRGRPTRLVVNGGFAARFTSRVVLHSWYLEALEGLDGATHRFVGMAVENLAQRFVRLSLHDRVPADRVTGVAARIDHLERST